HIAISFDGIPISYQVQGKGKPALVFVHGWCCDKSYWDAQVTHLHQKYKIVTIDLAGHGKSGFGRTDWTMTAFGEDIVAVVDKLGLDQVILVGHSMGGPVILEAARRMPKRIVGLVGVDTFRNVERKRTQTQVDETHARFRANFVEATRNAMRGDFAPTADPALVEKVLANMSACPPEVGLGAQKWYFDYVYINNELIRALQEVQTPIRCINSDRKPTNVEAAQRYAPSFEVVYMSGVGHFVMMEDPETFNRLLEETIQKFVDQKK
ncbi:MAG: alpha/beta hydrolase, partial [Candidatus Brocadiales bacterium]|nr:alpha/beta hydrolase [Candidatus Bathyanammoxibius sp.]